MSKFNQKSIVEACFLVDHHIQLNCERSEQKILDNSKQKQEFSSQATYPHADKGPPNNLQNCKRFTTNFMLHFLNNSTSS